MTLTHTFIRLDLHYLHAAAQTKPTALNCREERMEVSRKGEFSATVQKWIQGLGHLLIKDVRGTVLRLTKHNLQFPVTASNDLLVLKDNFAKSDFLLLHDRIRRHPPKSFSNVYLILCLCDLQM